MSATELKYPHLVPIDSPRTLSDLRLTPEGVAELPGVIKDLGLRVVANMVVSSTRASEICEEPLTVASLTHRLDIGQQYYTLPTSDLRLMVGPLMPAERADDTYHLEGFSVYQGSSENAFLAEFMQPLNSKAEVPMFTDQEIIRFISLAQKYSYQEVVGIGISGGSKLSVYSLVKQLAMTESRIHPRKLFAGPCIWPEDEVGEHRQYSGLMVYKKSSEEVPKAVSNE